MLSERSKIVIKAAVDLMCECVGRDSVIESLQKQGPRFVINSIPYSCEVSPEMRLDVASNREEADRYLAGLIGMM